MVFFLFGDLQSSPSKQLEVWWDLSQEKPHLWLASLLPISHAWGNTLNDHKPWISWSFPSLHFFFVCGFKNCFLDLWAKLICFLSQNLCFPHIIQTQVPPAISGLQQKIIINKHKPNTDEVSSNIRYSLAQFPASPSTPDQEMDSLGFGHCSALWGIHCPSGIDQFSVCNLRSKFNSPLNHS